MNKDAFTLQYMLKQNLYYFLGSNRKQELKELYTKLKTLYEERANIEVLKKEREEKLLFSIRA